MKKKIALLFTVIMILSLCCTPVMAAGTAGAADGVQTISTQAVKTGWVREGGYYKFYRNGKALTYGIYKIGTKLFGFSKKGNLCCGWFKINGNIYYGSKKSGARGIGVGEVLTGYRKIGNNYYYLTPAKKGAAWTGFKWTSGKLYYFNTTTGAQRRTKGWFYIGNKMYYVKADGTIATNCTVDGYRIGANGAVADVSGTDRKAQGYSSSTRYLILVNKSTHKVNIYQGSKGSWVNIRRDLPCTTGKSETPTPSGRYTLNHKSPNAYGYKDFTASTVFYTTRLSAGNYFHSVLYRLGCRNPYKSSPKNATLGKNRSNSCIRLRLEDAKFIHQVTPKNTRVIVY